MNLTTWMKYGLKRKAMTSLLLAMALGCAPAPEMNTREIPPRKENRILATEIENPGVVDLFKKEIQRFWGAPYVWGGASPAGTDCSGLIVTIYKRAMNISLPHSTYQLYRQGRSISGRELLFGDLLFFAPGGRGEPSHVGLYVAKGLFLHASVAEGVTLSRLADKPYFQEYLGARRILR